MRYFNIIQEVYRGRNDLSLFIFWVLLRVKKVFKVSFIPEAPTKTPIDAVIPTISKDFKTLSLVVESLKNVEQPIENIYIVAPPNKELISFCKTNRLNFVDETSVLGFGLNKITYTYKEQDRRGWLFQQLLKLSGENITKNEHYICVDSDTIFVSPTSFFKDKKYVFFTNEEWNQPYFDSFKAIFNYTAPTKLSFTSHMMIFNHSFLRKMKEEMEKKHNKPWHEVYTSSASPEIHSCISDYETYANWILYNHPERATSSPFYNRSVNPEKLSSLETLSKRFGKKYNSISFHSWQREP